MAIVKPGHSLLDEKIEVVQMMRRDVGRLYQLSEHSAFECYLLIEVKLGDQVVYDCPRSLSATCDFVQANHLLPKWLKAGIQEFLTYFYTNFDDLSADFFPTGKPYGRTEFFSSSTRIWLNVCAICDEHRPMTILRGEYYSDIEHYFPKSVYPHLACHPYNLIPICKPCNFARLDKDPLFTSDRSRRALHSNLLALSRKANLAGIN